VPAGKGMRGNLLQLIMRGTTSRLLAVYVCFISARQV